MADAVYNEWDSFAAAWMRCLIKAGALPEGRIDERSISDLTGADVAPISHFFAGIGGWAHALEIAGWPPVRPVWTASLPCQPFSVAGKGRGTDDERHLWPVFRDLVAECRPPTIFGEQVASRAGRAWLAGVRADLEALGYAVGAADLCAAGEGAPHIRQRLYWGAIRLADADSAGPFPWRAAPSPPRHRNTFDAGHWGGADWIECLDGKWRRIPAEPWLFPLANGFPNRVGALRGAGNAIVPQVAATFITAFMDASDGV